MQRENRSECQPFQLDPPRQDQIFFESANQDSGPNPPNLFNSRPQTKSKKQSKIVTFLARIDQNFTEQMQEYLLSHKRAYNDRIGKQREITLYEDILFIWGFKKAEQDIHRNKKQAIDKLCKQLEDTTKKTQLTIKERVEKKLANLEIEQIKEHMTHQLDFKFDKKQLVSSRTKPSVMSKSSNSDNQVKKQEKMEEFRKVQEKKKKEEENMITKSLFHPQSTTRSVYSYGSRPVTEHIKIFVNRKDKTMFAFKKSNFKKVDKKQPEKKPESVEQVQSIKQVDERVPSSELRPIEQQVEEDQSCRKLTKETKRKITDYFQQQKKKQQAQKVAQQFETIELQPTTNFYDKISDVKKVIQKQLKKLSKLKQTQDVKADLQFFQSQFQLLLKVEKQYEKNSRDSQEESAEQGKKSILTKQPESCQKEIEEK